MRVILTRQRLARSAAVAASALLLAAACNAKVPDQQPQPQNSASSSIGSTPVKAGTVLISNGTNTVVIGGKPVTFPTTVTDAAWSPDGSRIAFVDANKNIATARLNGTGLVVLTKAAAGVQRSSPTWQDQRIIYTYRDSKGVATLHTVWANGGRNDGEPDNDWLYTEADTPETGNTAPSGRPNGSGPDIAFQHTGSQGPEVWLVDLNQRVPSGAKLTAGAAAEISPDGSKVAFVAPNGQVAVISTLQQDAKPTQITFGAASPSHLAWTPDGTKVAFQTPTDVQLVSASVPAGATANPSEQLSATTGVPTFLPPPRDEVVRVAAADPVDRAIAISRMDFSDQPKYAPVDAGGIANGAALISTRVGLDAVRLFPELTYGPVLVTGGAGLDPRTKAELRRVLGTVTSGGPAPEILLIGGPDEISAQTESDVRSLGYLTRRLTSATNPLANQTNPSVVYVTDVTDAGSTAANASLFLDWASVSLYSKGGALPGAARTWLNQYGAGVSIVPMDAKAAQALAASWPGKPSALKVAATMNSLGPALAAAGGSSDCAVLVDRSSAIDVLLSVSFRCVVFAVDGKGSLDAAVTDWLSISSGAINQLYVVDGADAISETVQQSAARALSGPLGYAKVAPGKAPTVVLS
ncbi:MAG TPA: hypothetical protein VF163_18460 [Micromonosporaceae bacterium]